MVRASDVQSMEQILLGLLEPSSETIRQAEGLLKPLLKKASVVGVLVAVLSHGPQQADPGKRAAVRQIAAVVLRKKIVKLWGKLKKGAQAEVKAKILERLAAEEERAVRKSIAALASNLAKILVPTGKWPELLNFISTCAGDAQNPANRELAYILLLQLSETVASHLSNRLGELATLFRSALGDSDRTVAVAALRACCAFIATLSTDDEALLFRDLVPSMTAVARVAAQAKDDAVLTSFLDCFTELAQTPVPVLHPHLVDVTQLLLDIMRAPDEALDRSTRDGAASTLSSLAEWKPKLLGKANLIPAIVETCIGIMARDETTKHPAGSIFMSQPLQRLREEERAIQKQIQQQKLGGHFAPAANDDDDDDDEDFEGPSAQEMSQTTLDQVALHVPLKWSLEPTLTLASRCLQPSEPQATRRAGAATIGVVAEGFQDALREKHLGDVLRLLEQAAQQSDAATRECLCFAYGQLAEHCQPEIVAYAPAVLPVVFEFLKDDRAAVVGTACYVLEMFCESMDNEQIMPLFESIMERLLYLLQHHLLVIREMAAAAIGSAAIAAMDDFTPYLKRAGDAFASMICRTDEAAWELRGRCLEALGHIALAVGPVPFAPYRDTALASASANLDLDSTELHEYAYGFFANMAKVMRHEFAPLIPTFIPHILDVIRRKDGGTFDFADLSDDDDDDQGGRMAFLDDDDDDDNEFEPPQEGGDDDDWEDVGTARSNGAVAGDEDDDDVLAGHAVLQVRTAMMNVKKAAIVALGNVAEFTDGALVDHLGPSLEVMQLSLLYLISDIRERSAVALAQLVHGACVARGGDKRNEVFNTPGAAMALARQTRKEPKAIAWTKGDASLRLDPMLQRYIDECIKCLINLLIVDTSKTVVANACEALGDLLADVGPAALMHDSSNDRSLDKLCKAVLDLANGASACQTLLHGDDAALDNDPAFRAAIPGATADDDDDDHDHQLMDNVADLAGSITKTAGGLIGQDGSDAMFQAFAKYLQPSRSALDRAMALGCYAEMCFELPPELAATRHFATLHPLFVQGCGDPHASVTRNAAFGLGALFAKASRDLARPHFQSALQTLFPLLTRADAAPPETKAADRAAADNAVASMCRIAMADLDSTPIDQVLAVVVPLLPLCEDAGENKTVFDCLLTLLNANHPSLTNLLPELRRAFNDVVTQNKIDDLDIAQRVAHANAQLSASA